MKRRVLLLTSAVMLMLFCTGLFAQTVSNGDTLEVGPLNSEGQPLGALNEAIHGDTLADGSRAHTVYKLTPNAQYILTEVIQADFPLNIVAPMPTDENRPPIIRCGLKADGSSVDLWWNLYDNTVFKNIWVSGINLDGTGPISWISQVVNSTNKTIAYYNCIIEFPYTWWAMFADYGSNNTYICEDCVFQYIGNPTGTTWNGAIMNAAVQDSVIYTNSTFYDFGCFATNGEAFYTEIDHCTFVNCVVHPVNSHTQIQKVYSNNIFVNCHAFSDDTDEVSRHYDQEVKGLMNYAEIQWAQQKVDSLYGPGGIYGQNYDPDGDGALMLEEQSWVLENNAWFYTQPVQDYWAAYSNVTEPVFPNPWMNGYNAAMFEHANDAGQWSWVITRIDTLGNPIPGADTTVYHMPFKYFSEENTWNVDPGIVDMNGSDALLATNCDNIRKTWAGETVTDVKWHGVADYLAFTWPLDYDLSYTNATLQTAGTDGLPLGDLRWFDYVAVENPKHTASTFELEANYPNPFNPTTTINYTVNTAGNVELAVYNILGEKVKSLVSQKMAAGRHEVTWNATNDLGVRVATGVYFYKLEMGDQVQVNKMLLVK